MLSRLSARAAFIMVLTGSLMAGAPALRAGQNGAPEALAGEEPRAEQLKALPSALEAELWLAAEFPEGFTLAEAPDFFAAADEVFFEAQEQLLVFAYRSAITGRWIAWVAFDAEGQGVSHSAAIELGR